MVAEELFSCQGKLSTLATTFLVRIFQLTVEATEMLHSDLGETPQHPVEARLVISLGEDAKVGRARELTARIWRRRSKHLEVEQLELVKKSLVLQLIPKLLLK